MSKAHPPDYGGNESEILLDTTKVNTEIIQHEKRYARSKRLLRGFPAEQR